MLKKLGKIQKVITLLLILSMLLTTTPDVFASSKMKTYKGSGFDVSFIVDGQWSGAANGRVIVKNTSNATIHNWALNFEFGYDITSIYNAVIVNHSNNQYLIKNVVHNQDIMPGQEINFGFGFKVEGEIVLPNTYTIPSKDLVVNEAQYTIKYNILSDWGSGFNGEFVIKNSSKQAIEDWMLEFDFNGTIDNLWTAQLISHEGNHYLIKNAGYNGNIEPGSELRVGFGGKRSGKEIPLNYILSQVDIGDGDNQDNDDTIDSKIDSDKDGLKDYLEELIGTDPNNPDSDNDKLTDGYEFKILNTDPKKSDTDGNGVLDDDEDLDKDKLSNYNEYLMGTDPYTADTDGDSLLDSEESHHKTDPLLYDTDGDQISDGDEVKLGLNPLSKKTHEGILDNEYTIEQEVDDTQIAINKGNDYRLSVELNAAGLASNELKVEESNYKALLSDNDSIIGKVTNISYGEFLIKDAKLNFKIDSKLIQRTNLNYPDEPGLEGIQRFQIFKYNETYGILYPVETEYDMDNNIVSLKTIDLGTYCIVDLDQWLYELGTNFNDKDNTMNSEEAFVQNKVNQEKEEISQKVDVKKHEDVEVVSTDDRLPNNYEDMVLRQIEKVCNQDLGITRSNLSAKSDVISSIKAKLSTMNYNKQIDLVFAIDTSASMGDMIDQCKSYMKTLIQNLYKDGVTARVAIISFDDYENENITYQLDSGSIWGKNPSEASELISKVNLTDGASENHVDALETVLNLSYRSNTTKFAVLLTDEELVTDNNNSKIGASGIAQKLKKANIITSVICMNEDSSTYESIYEETNGILVSISSDFKLYLELFIKTVMKESKTFLAVVPTTLTTVTLKKTPNKSDKVTDTDGDTLADSDEIDWKLIRFDANTLILPTMAEYFDSMGLKDREKFSRLKAEKADIINSMVVLPIISNPEKKDSDKDSYNDNIDAYPLVYITKISYIYYEKAGDGFLKDEAISREKAINKRKGNVKVYGVNTVADFTSKWNDMGLDKKGKVEFEISDVYTVFHGSPTSISVGNSEWLTTATINNLANKEIDILHLSSCNNGNLDRINSFTYKNKTYEQNIAISFLKTHSKISKVKAWDGYATYIEIAGKQVEYSSSYTDFWEAIFDNSTFDEWSKAKNGYKRIPTGLITYSRDSSNKITYSPSNKYYYAYIGLSRIMQVDKMTEVIK